ncbi:MAG TPA: SWIM zinc finger family protein [Pirellulales bacterium]|nr:SWIM zinc finger family protein [Pirellulales bacterium]
MSTAISYTYAYPFDSAVLEHSGRPAIRLVTSLEETSDDLFFDGHLRRPALAGRCLSILAAIVRTRFFQQAPALVWTDPVVTSGGGMLRFEGFSSCCGVYARVDLSPDAFDVELRGKGTTNVDFNDAMRTALRRMNDEENAKLQVGGDGVTLIRGDEQVVERKVKLPVRWVKGFCEVQAYQPRMTPQLELSAAEARELFRSLPPVSNGYRPVHIARTGQKVRLASRPVRGSVQVRGVERVRVLEGLVPFAQKLLIWYDEESQTSGWEFRFEIGRFFSLVSPELNRGFSGEGQMLARLATADWQQPLPAVAESLNWQSQIEPGQLAMRFGCGESSIEAALAVLGARGLVGYDLSTGRYFHRVLPFDVGKVESQQPRLKAARELVASGTCRIVKQQNGETHLQIPGSDVHHFVRLEAEGDRCSCRWCNRYRGQRGPCKHILAARLMVEGEESPLINTLCYDATSE